VSAPPGADALGEGVQRTGSSRRGPRRLGQRMPAAAEPSFEIRPRRGFATPDWRSLGSEDGKLVLILLAQTRKPTATRPRSTSWRGTGKRSCAIWNCARRRAGEE